MHIQRGEVVEIGGDGGDRKAHLAVIRNSGETIAPSRGDGKIIRAGDARDAGKTAHGGFYLRIAAMDIPVDGQHDDVVAVETEVFVADIVHLLEYHHRSDDQEKRDRELKHDERAPKT